jgi:hypothetical protein
MRRHSLVFLFLLAITLFIPGCQDFLLPGLGDDEFLSADVKPKQKHYNDFLNSDSAGGSLTSDTSNSIPIETVSQITREIEEADIVKHLDQYLYILNRARGLRIVNVADWAAPVLKGSVPFLGEPVEMYVNNNVATVITRSNSPIRLDDQAQPASQGQSMIYAIDIANPDAPSIINSFSIDGYIQETRRVGQVIYLTGYKTTTYPGTYDTNSNDSEENDDIDSFVASVYVADPQTIHLVEQKDFVGQGEFIHATANAIFIAGTQWETDNTSIQYVDISSLEGAIALRGQIEVPGRIINRFALNAFENSLRVITETSDRSVNLYTYSIADPSAITLLSTLPIINNETLRAIRFEGTRGYAVTFRQTDPLWILDLSNPADPKITGHLQVPGYSTYLESDGNFLIAVGVNNGNWGEPTVMLYNIADPANPREINRLVLGGYTASSVANNDDKAFKVLPEAKLILVPVDTSSSNGSKHTLQMIDYSSGTLVQLASIEHTDLVQRSGIDLDANILWVLSQQTLQTLNIQNRQAPQTLASLPLAENVLAWKVVGEYGLRLVQIDNNVSVPTQEIQVLAASDPNGNQILSRLQLKACDPRFFIANNSLAVVAGMGVNQETNLFTLNISSLPNISITAEKVFDFHTAYWDGNYYYGRSTISYYGGYYPNIIWPYSHTSCMNYRDNIFLLDNLGMVFVSYSGIQIVSLADPASPSLVQTISTGDNDVAHVGVSGNTLFYTTRESDDDDLDIPLLASIRSVTPKASYYLNRIDCSDLTNISQESPINVPGFTAHLRDDIAFTFDPQWKDDQIQTRFCASRLQNNKAVMIGKVDLPSSQPNSFIFTEKAAFLTLSGNSGTIYYTNYDTFLASNIYYSYATSSDFDLVSIDIEDPQSLQVKTQTNYKGNGRIIGQTDQSLVVGVSSSSQALLLQIADDQTLSLKDVMDVPGTIQDLTTTNGLINLICGRAGILQVNPNP